MRKNIIIIIIIINKKDAPSYANPKNFFPIIRIIKTNLKIKFDNIYYFSIIIFPIKSFSILSISSGLKKYS